MKLLDEHARGGVRFRITDCGCGEDDCDTRFVFATTHDRLWMVVGVTNSHQDAVDMVDTLLLDLQLEPTRIVGMVASGVALFGMLWARLARGRVIEQLEAVKMAPQWMFNVPVRQVWACRRVVFGDDLTRVPRALAAVSAAYVDERPVRIGER